MTKIFIDAGHGGSSIGAAYKGRKEQDDCLKLALAVKNKLLTQKNVEVMLSREKDTNPDISKRCKMANDWGANYFLSVHRNSSVKANTATGCEIWCYSKIKKGGITYTMAEKILNSLCEATGYTNRGVKLGAPSYTDFGVNSGTNMSSALLEIGFINNKSDNSVFDKKFDAIAESIAKGVYEANGGKWVNQVFSVEVSPFSSEKEAIKYAEKAKKSGFKATVTVKGE